jgi:hypothetical protein
VQSVAYLLGQVFARTRHLAQVSQPGAFEAFGAAEMANERKSPPLPYTGQRVEQEILGNLPYLRTAGMRPTC